MAENPLKRLADLGQSIWLDYIRRDLMSSGKLRRLIEHDGLKGMTSNPTIFEKAIAESHDYDDQVQAMVRQGLPPGRIYELLSQQDVRDAADQFRECYERTSGQDGFVSLEVNPHLARDTQKSVEEARALWSALDRPNVMIKVPATQAGLAAIRTLVSEGLNINITLLFGLGRYREVVDAYLGGLEARVAAGKPLDRIASVASFFVSRIDTLVDPLLRDLAKRSAAWNARVEPLLGQVAVANAKMAYQIYKEIFGGKRFAALAAKGAHPQRLLWASTGTKDPSYSDVKYVEALVAPDTVNTVPPETLDAYRDHGRPEVRIERDLAAAERVLGQLPELGIDLDEVTRRLEEDGISKFNQPFDKLLGALERACEAVQAAARRAEAR